MDTKDPCNVYCGKFVTTDVWRDLIHSLVTFLKLAESGSFKDRNTSCSLFVLLSYRWTLMIICASQDQSVSSDSDVAERAGGLTAIRRLVNSIHHDSNSSLLQCLDCSNYRE